VSLLPAQQTPLTFHPRGQQTAFRHRGARRQSRLFARENLRLRHSPNSTRLYSDCQQRFPNTLWIAACSSKNALSLSSARTTNRRPSRAYASAVKITRPVESVSDEQPQLKPAWLSCSAMAGQSEKESQRKTLKGRTKPPYSPPDRMAADSEIRSTTR